MVLNAAYLLQTAKREAFSEAVERLAGRHPAIQLHVSGPWPPYSFAGLDQARDGHAEVAP